MADFLEWKACKELGNYFAVDLYKGQKYLLCRAMLDDGSIEGTEDDSGQVEECPESEREALTALFPEDIEAVNSVIFY